LKKTLYCVHIFKINL